MATFVIQSQPPPPAKKESKKQGWETYLIVSGGMSFLFSIVALVLLYELDQADDTRQYTKSEQNSIKSVWAMLISNTVLTFIFIILIMLYKFRKLGFLGVFVTGILLIIAYCMTIYFLYDMSINTFGEKEPLTPNEARFEMGLWIIVTFSLAGTVTLLFSTLAFAITRKK